MQPCACISCAIQRATDRITAYRIYRGWRDDDMALELRGLKAKALKARSNIDGLNSAYDKFNEAAPAHAADVAGLTEQISGMQDDLQFAVTTLGNSVAPSDEQSDTATQPPPEAQQTASR